VYEDRPKKPGWITTGPAGSRLEMDVQFCASPLLLITYVRGWTDEWGTIQVRVSNVRRRAAFAPEPTPRFKWNTNRCNLRARRDDANHVTQTAVAIFDAGKPYMQNYATMASWPPSFNGILGFGVPPHSTATVSATLLGSSCPDAPHSGSGSGARASGCKFKITSVTAC
jgi:hypothetical protein